MSRISLGEVESLPDPLDSGSFELVFGNIPGVGNEKSLRIKVIDVVIPGFSNESWQLAVHGFVFNHRGRKMYPRILPVSFYEDSQFKTLTALRKWHEFIVGTQTATSLAFKNPNANGNGYAVEAQLIVYDIKGQAINTMYLQGVYPQDIPDVQLTGEASQFTRVQVSFNYDYFIDPNITSESSNDGVVLSGQAAITT